MREADHYCLGMPMKLLQLLKRLMASTLLSSPATFFLYVVSLSRTRGNPCGSSQLPDLVAFHVAVQPPSQKVNACNLGWSKEQFHWKSTPGIVTKCK